MGTLLEHFRATGVTFEARAGGTLRAIGTLTDVARAIIREQKVAILAELAANDAAPVLVLAAASPPNTEASRPIATREQEAELRELVARVSAGWPNNEPTEALAAALADPVAALECYRYLAADLPPAPRPTYTLATTLPIDERDPDDDRRLCTECANLTPGGRCLAARRGEGPAVYGASRDYVPILGQLGRCAGYAPRASDPDQRSGTKRWPSLVEDAQRYRERALRGY
ncbi:MAG: hypothetical protein IT516_17315 [Burkholderiales bacterium]|nr:hypothetical protein [Burkholderiales bacterium]